MFTIPFSACCLQYDSGSGSDPVVKRHEIYRKPHGVKALQPEATLHGCLRVAGNDLNRASTRCYHSCYDRSAVAKLRNIALLVPTLAQAIVSGGPAGEAGSRGSRRRAPLNPNAIDSRGTHVNVEGGSGPNFARIGVSF